MTVLGDFRGFGPDYEDRSLQVPLRLSPAEWRRILEDPTFLEDAGNEYASPRRFHGIPVEITPPTHRR